MNLVRQYSMGQIGGSIVDEAAKKIVTQADPVVRRIVSEERSRVATAFQNVLPYAGASALAFLGTAYLAPQMPPAYKFVGYAASAAILGVGLWKTLGDLSTPPEPVAPQTSAIADLAKPIADQLAKSVVTESEPRVREIVREEEARITGAVKSMLPWAGLSGAAALGTAFLVPDSKPIGKLAGYGAAIALLVGGAWGALSKVA